MSHLKKDLILVLLLILLIGASYTALYFMENNSGFLTQISSHLGL